LQLFDCLLSFITLSSNTTSTTTTTAAAATNANADADANTNTNAAWPRSHAHNDCNSNQFILD
jgi:hypothetical protein